LSDTLKDLLEKLDAKAAALSESVQRCQELQDQARALYGRIMQNRQSWSDVTESWRTQVAGTLREAEERLSLLVEDVEDYAIFMLDPRGRVVSWNAGAQRVNGYAREEILGRNFSCFYPDADIELGKPEQVLHQAETQGSVHCRGWRIRKDGSRFMADVVVTALKEDTGALRGFVKITRDVSERMQAEAQLRDAKERLTRALRGSGLALWDIDVPGRKVYLSESWVEMLGVKPSSNVITISELLELVPPDEQRELIETSRGVIRGRIPEYNVEHRIITASGERIWIHSRGKVVERDAAGRALWMSGTSADITERKRAESRIQHLATRDALTDLPNRLLLGDRLQQALAVAHRDGSALAVLFIDLDRFKTVNDSLGHPIGDTLLLRTAERLKVCLREEDTVARQGGDEFIVLVPGIADQRSAALVAEKILEVLSRPVNADSHELVVTGSIGIALYPDDGRDASTLLKNADTAMYHAKESGRNTYQFFTARMNELAQQRLELEADLRRAMVQSELMLHYQPKVKLANSAVIGMEALARWQHPQRGLISPTKFIPVAEDAGLIAGIGEWALDQACRQSLAWQRAGYSRLQVAVNVSARQFRGQHFVEKVSRILAETGVDPRSLELEITESTIMESAVEAVAVLEALRAMGIELAVDDFGTAYSSLSYLKRLPIDRVKIDQSFVRDVPSDSDDAAIVRAIVAMAHSLDLTVIAEGVETKTQLDFLRQVNCDEAQGYYFGRPLPAAELTAVLESGAG
jgi:diguanylate cyclase (GGDEF)-like protein/PAS domain S-box-containing protein